MRESYTSGAKWEDLVSYRRAVKIGNTIEVSGTTATVNGAIVGKDMPYEQALCCLKIVVESVEALGGSVSDIIRTRMYVTNISQWEEIGRAHHEVFNKYPPATTMVEVSKLIDPDLLVEIEATAILSNDR